MVPLDSGAVLTVKYSLFPSPCCWRAATHHHEDADNVLLEVRVVPVAKVLRHIPQRQRHCEGDKDPRRKPSLHVHLCVVPAVWDAGEARQGGGGMCVLCVRVVCVICDFEGRNPLGVRSQLDDAPRKEAKDNQQQEKDDEVAWWVRDQRQG